MAVFLRPARALALAISLLGAQAGAADFPAPVNTQEGSPMPADKALATIKLPAAFKPTLFASEPEVQQPIAMATDARRRLWVAENYTYGDAKVGFDLNQRDRIVILEDTDGDGKSDKRTVFWDQGQRLSSIELGFGGVYVLCAPQLLFIPDKNGDDVPDGKPVVLLDGFDSGPVRHNIVNGLRWGPDGWLYGRHGIQATSRVGAPGTPDARRTALNCGIWRYHPVKKIFEVVASGTTNPWGMDWDRFGEAFFTNTVIGHLWHVIPGAHYQRMYGEDLTSRTYELIQQTADHYHWDTTGTWQQSRENKDGMDAYGGGHCHEGCLIPQGPAWPVAEYGDRLLTINFYGRRINMEKLERDGSGYVAKHSPDFLSIADPWFRGVDLLHAPSGGFFMSDWSDTGECHENEGVHRTSGRIYEISSTATIPAPVANLNSLNNLQLLESQSAGLVWQTRTAQRLLQERAAAGAKMPEVRTKLLADLAPKSERTVEQQLQALWNLHAIGGATDAVLRKLLAHPDEHLRVWAIRFLTEDRGALKTVSPDLLRLAEKDPSPAVRLALASALQRYPVEARPALARPLLQHGEDAKDRNIPLMLWYGLLPLGDSDPGQLATLGSRAKIPATVRCISRRLAESIDREPLAVDVLLGGALAGPPEVQVAVLEGLSAGLKKATSAPMPVAWEQFAAKLGDAGDAAPREQLNALDKLFAAGQVLSDARRTVLDPKMLPDERRTALEQLMDAQAPGLRETCTQLFPDPVMRFPAALVLISLDDPADAPAIFAQTKASEEPQRSLLYTALASRPHHAACLVEAVAKKDLPRSAITPAVVEKIRAAEDQALIKKLDSLPAVPEKPAPAKKKGKKSPNT